MHTANTGPLAITVIMPPSRIGVVRDAGDQMQDAILAAGLTAPDRIIADGKIHRFSTNGKPSDFAGWYVLFDGDVPAGRFGCWREGVDQKWRADIGRKLTAAEELKSRKRTEAMKRMADDERQKRRSQAKTRADALWDVSNPAAADHPYLVRKGVGAHGIRQTPLSGDLLVPLRDDRGALHSLPIIDDAGSQRFAGGGRTAGCYHSIGELGNVICIAEGYATAATIFEATGYSCFAAFNAGNLLAVAKAMHARFPASRLILCADDDCNTPGNPGLKAPNEAARTVGGVLALPDFGVQRLEGATDFNDLAAMRGLAQVKQAIVGLVETQALGDGSHDAGTRVAD